MDDSLRSQLQAIPWHICVRSFSDVDYRGQLVKMAASENPRLSRSSLLEGTQEELWRGFERGEVFSISDLSGPEPNDYQLSLLADSVKLGDEECWQIESTPRNEEVRAKTGYSKTQLWISKSKQVLVQLTAWAADGKKTKYFKASDLRQVDGFWTPHRLQMRTLVQGGESTETVIGLRWSFAAN